MKLIAKTPCSFGGKKFFIGNDIPAEYVLNPKAQEKLGVITIVDGENAPGEKPVGSPAPGSLINVTIHVEEGDIPLELTSEGLQQIFDIFSSNVETAESIIAEMSDGDALLLLHASDNRKSIKAAAEARAKAISEDGAGENPENPEGENDPGSPEDGAGEIPNAPEGEDDPENPEDGAGEE